MQSELRTERNRQTQPYPQNYENPYKRFNVITVHERKQREQVCQQRQTNNKQTAVITKISVNGTETARV